MLSVSSLSPALESLIQSLDSRSQSEEASLSRWEPAVVWGSRCWGGLVHRWLARACQARLAWGRTGGCFLGFLLWVDQAVWAWGSEACQLFSWCIPFACQAFPAAPTEPQDGLIASQIPAATKTQIWVWDNRQGLLNYSSQFKYGHITALIDE